MRSIYSKIKEIIKLISVDFGGGSFFPTAIVFKENNCFSCAIEPYTEDNAKEENVTNDIVDLLIIDDCFPHPLTAFRCQEFKSYLEEISSINIVSTGISVGCIGNENISELIKDYKRKYPAFGAKVEEFNSSLLKKCKLLYCVFLGNIYHFFDFVSYNNIPFIFTLYPGGHFALNNPKSDKKLRQIMSSPLFKKVIVTQKITYDYLINNNFCTPDKIEYIFGVVTPLDKIAIEYTNKKHYGIDKNTLDICFVAHKYTEKGQDKGYDLFIQSAKELCKLYDNIYFHIVGPWNEDIIDISDIKNKVTFYGSQQQDWFDSFYQDKDIILAPNRPDNISKGSFDGFPTASCTDAGLRKTAIFCSDELNLNDKYYIENEENCHY
ncbi:MAG: glycosyltransferase [Ignavibacteriales bacterium]|nr:glycosyltransferase [Ignavibacteriales bacterium]